MAAGAKMAKPIRSRGDERERIIDIGGGLGNCSGIRTSISSIAMRPPTGRLM